VPAQLAVPSDRLPAARRGDAHEPESLRTTGPRSSHASDSIDQ
jgi:hypothetical protein